MLRQRHSVARAPTAQGGRRQDERGQLVALFAIALFTLLLFVSLSINVGQAVVRRHHAQLLADTGALAGAAVQARGLNQMTRLNAAALRVFNVFQLRSRVGGYHEWRIPILSTMEQLSGTRNFPKTRTRRVRTRDGKITTRQTSTAPWVRWLVCKVWPCDANWVDRDDLDAMRNMESWFANFRGGIRAANVFWEMNARYTARAVTLENMRTLVGGESYRTCRAAPSDCMRPLVDPGVRDVWATIKSVYGDYAEEKKKPGGSKQGLKDWFTGIGFVKNHRGFDIVEKAGTPRLISEWQNPDGDVLIVRYWTDLTEGEKDAFEITVKLIAENPATVAATLGFSLVVSKIVLWGLEAESWLRRVSAPKWHDMRTTLHRKRATKADDQAKLDTRFVYWVRLPTTGPSMSVLYPFSDLEDITAVAVAKPIGGNFGDYPQPGEIVPQGLARFKRAFEQLVGRVLTETEHVVGGTDHSTRRVKMRNKKAATSDRRSFWEEDKSRIGDVYATTELTAMGIDAGSPPNVFWYLSPFHPYYEPRLVPYQKAWKDDFKSLDLEDATLEQLAELYARPAKKAKP